VTISSTGFDEHPVKIPTAHANRSGPVADRETSVVNNDREVVT